MNFASIAPRPTIGMNRPVKVSPKGNMYKVALTHAGENGENAKKYEIWMTREAVQKHFNGMTEDPRSYQLKKFAQLTYEKQLRSLRGPLQHNGILVTTDSVSHGNPKLWPSTISHPEVKL